MVTPPARVLLVVLAALALVATACSNEASELDRATDTAAADYCEESGGTVETRTPYWNTNGDQSVWLELPGEMTLCWFNLLDDDDDSRIYLDLNTLYSETPTLAAAAYLAQLPLSGSVAGNPATINCGEQLYGSASFGNTAAGGGWVNLDDPVFTVVNLCVFPDGSAIDEWGIAYYSEGVARGVDLSELFRFDISDVPPMFG